LRLALGTVQFGQKYGVANQHGQMSLDEAAAIIGHSHANGIDTLDTAIAYGNSEQRLGEIGIKGWRVVSKLPAFPEHCNDIYEYAALAVHESLQRLKIDTLYGLLLHRPQQLLEQGGDRVYAALQQLRHNGIVHKIGISIYDPSELDAICSRYQIDIVQAPFNIMDRRMIDTGWLSRLPKQGTELHVRSIFLQGLLLMRPSDRPDRFARWKSNWHAWDTWLEHTGLTPLQACLRYALSFSEISKVIVGVDSLLQLKEILTAQAGPPPQIPNGISTRELDLLNPSQWAALI
jgi:aryl-alcohol dehydrogenase-like predicted oxidoreductase